MSFKRVPDPVRPRSQAIVRPAVQPRGTAIGPPVFTPPVAQPLRAGTTATRQPLHRPAARTSGSIQRMTETQAMIENKDGYLKSKKKVEEHNLRRPGHQVLFSNLLGKAKTVKELGSLVFAAIDAAEKRATAPQQQKVDDSDLDAKYGTPQGTQTISTPKPHPKPSVPTTQPGNSTPTISIGLTPYQPPPQVIVDPYAGLNTRTKPHAQRLLTTGLGGTMTGATDMSLNQGDINELRNWVEKQETNSGLQKWVVNVGPGTGTFSLNNQFKVTGFGTVVGTNKAPTYHVTINNNLY